ncbi:MAG: arsenosugar biosynthesis radical SAM protein ArsS [Gammaproteobacteria bacterium]|nr:arsenosugar biosynthesis radical SAM protein ArsS [Gammaproteobacteria bacterium]
MRAILPHLEATDFPALTRKRSETLQVNLGYRCNQSCIHCHVNAGPRRTEMMSEETVAQIVDLLGRDAFRTLDITGGAPELHPHFRILASAARTLDIAVIDRCNLTILEEPGQEDLAEFLARQQVNIVASLPCYLEENVDAQRGAGVFQASIRALRRLNAFGYGRPDSGLSLNLVFNPQGPSLPPPQSTLQADYKTLLGERYGVVFNELFTLANMPIQRFGSLLLSKGQFHDYIALLKNAHRDENLQSVMCLNLISVDWQGYLYDCDFNQMLGLPLTHGDRRQLTVRDLLDIDLQNNPIRIADHCYGCTAGQGSSCGGALT